MDFNVQAPEVVCVYEKRWRKAHILLHTFRIFLQCHKSDLVCRVFSGSSFSHPLCLQLMK